VELQVRNIKGDNKGVVNFCDNIKIEKVNKALLHEVIENYLANQRQGNASVKTRAEVSGGGKKPWKQKGTGRARAGSNRSPIWRKGGIIFGPKPRDYSYSIPSKKKNSALLQSLVDKYQKKELIVIDDIDANIKKTKEVVGLLKNFDIKKNVLIVLNEKKELLERSTKNIPYAKLTYANKLNVYDVLYADTVIIIKSAVDFLNTKLGE
jgi:large subunit ribosomal protein L4